MPTDEQQMREQFEAQRLPSYSQEVRDRLFEVDDLGQYTNHSMNSEWIGWKDGYRARDAEVRKLRELLTQVTEELAEEIEGNYKARYGDPIHPAMEGRYARDMDTVYRARKLLAGGEEGGAE